jgi:hypothetical protein
METHFLSQSSGNLFCFFLACNTFDEGCISTSFSGSFVSINKVLNAD